MQLPDDYAERVYAGVLGKIIGVYLGRPFEGWTYERILKELGEITYYVNDRVEGKPPLVATDDDIIGTLTFIRALVDYRSKIPLPEHLRETWLNYIIENKSILWWGGLGNSTEHTAYINLKNGILPPESGSINLNGRLLAEQIGSQIFIDAWAMVCPGDPEQAADLAGRAASVSHGGEAVYGAQVIAAMESAAFTEKNIDRIIDTAVSLIPADSEIYRLVEDVRNIKEKEPDWHRGFLQMRKTYNYRTYGGNCHIIPNHGLILLALLYGKGDFNESMKIVNTAGWDTDCNSGNLGCLLGIRDGLSTFDHGNDWRGPLADRIFMSTADGGRAISDAVTEAVQIVNIGRSMRNLEPLLYKEGARFNFEFPGSIKGFSGEEPTTVIENVKGNSLLGARSLKISVAGSGRVSTPTFILPDETDMGEYELLASPTLYSGQLLKTNIFSSGEAKARLFISVYGDNDELLPLYGKYVDLKGKKNTVIEWTVPDTLGQPIARVGLDIQSPEGTVYLDYLTWSGDPVITLGRPKPKAAGTNVPSVMWRKAWVEAVDLWDIYWQEAYSLVQNSGRGLLMQGTRQWHNYEVETVITPWHMQAGGIAARVQGLRRYYVLQLIQGNRVQLVKALDGDMVLGTSDFKWEYNCRYHLKLSVLGNKIKAWVDGKLAFDVTDNNRPLMDGGVAYVIEDGHLTSEAIKVTTIQNN